jgi:ubiquinone/menaquinone biosynthesis C-methylase UbiE
MIADDYEYLAPGGRSFTLTAGALARLNRKSRVLEIASGRGEAACALAERFGCRVEAFDIDPNMVESSREKAAGRGLDERVSFQVMDGRNMDFGDGCYDLILAEGGAMTYVGREEGVERCATLLKDGRTLAITDLIYLNKEVPEAVRKAYEEGVYGYLTEIEYRQLLERQGFEITHLSLLPQSAWDRYYMAMQRTVSRPGGFVTDEFRNAMLDEIDVYYEKEGMHYVGYVFIVAKMARDRQVREGPKNLRVPVFGIWPQADKTRAARR